MTEPRIFISSVTSELGSYRDELARLLRKHQFVVKVQTDFNPTEKEYLLPMLHDYIQTCHVVICLVGDRYGYEPVGPESTDFAFTYGVVDGDVATPRYSYTQWEYLFARKMNKAVFVFMPTPELVRDPKHLAAPEEETLASLQASFIASEIRGKGKTRTPFDSLEKLKEEVHSIDFVRLAQAQNHDVPFIRESPYVGLRPFRETERSQFYGRDKLIDELSGASEASPLLLVLGSSGSGKSSAIRAGVIPTLRRKSEGRARIVVFNPDVDPFEGFYAGLLQAEFPQEAARFARNPKPNIILECFTKLRAPDESWLIVIDQFEEIFTRTPKNEEAQARLRHFVAALVSVANRPDPALRIILAMRDDFFSNLEGHKALCDITDESFRRVTGMTDRELRAVIQNPAASHGVSFEPGLIDTILRDVQDPRGRLPLPLLQYTLDTLWKEDDVSDRILNHSTYERIGGVKGALQKKVTDYYDALSPDHKRSLRRILLRLVEIGVKEIPVSRAAQKSELDTDLDGEVLEQLLNHEKLLIAKEGTSGARGDSTVELAHEALISGWEEYHVWVAESREAISLRNALYHDARQWHRLLKSDKPTERKRASAEFWDGSRLERALELQSVDGFEQIGGLGELEGDFLRESGKEREREIVRLRRRNLILSGLSILAIAGAIYGFLSSREAQRQNAEATSQRDEARYNEGLSWMLRAQVAEERKNQYPDTLLYAAQAIGFEGVGRPADAPESLLRFIRKDRNPEAYERVREWIAGRPAYLPVWSTAPSPYPSTGLDVSSDGRHLALATADGAVRLWDLREQTMRELQKITKQAGNVAFDPMGERLAALSEKEVHIYTLSGEKSSSFFENSQTLAYSPDGEILATAGTDGSIRLQRDGKVTVIETGMEHAASTICFSADNSRAAAAFLGGIRPFFPHYSALANHPWIGNQEKSSAVALSPNGLRLVAGTPEGEVVIYDAASAAVLGRCSGEQRHGAAVLDLAFRPDGRQLASASTDGTVRLWNVSGNVPAITATLRGHSGAVSKVAWFPGGGLLATAGADGSARIWDTRGAPVAAPDLHHYLGAEWYQLDPITREATWSGGEGAVNVPADSLLGLHRSKAEATPALLATGSWNGLPPQTDAPPSLVAQVETAAKAERWREVNLRLGQIDRLKPLASTLDNIRQQIADLGAAGKPLRNLEGIELVWVKPSTFQMGSSEIEQGSKNNENLRKVTLTQGYWLAKTELTQAQWQSVMGNNPSTYASAGLQAPVENISWEEAMDYCRRLTDLERARGAIPFGWEYSLPTEAQWESAYRAGSSKPFCFGFNFTPEELHEYANYNEISGGHPNHDADHNDNHQYSAPVGSYLPNKWGFYDLHGNVLEWCLDSMDADNQNYDERDLIDPLGVTGIWRVVRGGSFFPLLKIVDQHFVLRICPPIATTAWASARH